MPILWKKEIKASETIKKSESIVDQPDTKAYS